VNTAIEILNETDADEVSVFTTFNRRNKDGLYAECLLILNQNGEIDYCNTEPLSVAKDSVFIKQIYQKNQLFYTDGEYELFGKKTLKSNKPYVVIVAGIDKFGKEKVQKLAYNLLTVFLLGLILAGLAGYFFSGSVLRPIKQVIQETSTIDENNLSFRLSEGNGHDEISGLLKTLNKLLDRIEVAFKVQKTFVANASHEMRNPLTAITAQLEVSLINDRSPEDYKKIIESVLEDIKDVNNTYNRLLSLARMSGYNTEPDLNSIRIDDSVWIARDKILKVNPDYKVNVLTDNFPDDEKEMYIHANEALLTMALQNLIENACKFSEDKSSDISFVFKKGSISIHINDKGIGIRREELPYIFEPFFRTNNTANVRGHGLGLSIVKRIADLHKAVIKVNSIPGKGTEFILTFFR
jgi:signal transduction histidine kinase